MSMPRAAMSVAASTRTRPALKSLRACTRAVWLLLPWMAAAEMPRFWRSWAMRLAPCLVRENTRAEVMRRSSMRWASSLVLLALST